MDVGTLTAEEKVFVDGAPHRRLHEFALGRRCARSALMQLGIIASVPASPRGYPLWPPEIVGSISHCDRLCVAVACKNSNVVGVGIDVEVVTDVTPELLPLIAVESERRFLKEEPDFPVSVLFSAKEAAFKCWFPKTHFYLGFLDVEVRVSRTGSFRLTSQKADLSKINGRFAIRGDLVAAIAYLQR